MESFPEYINILNYLFVGVYIFSVTLETTHAEIVAELTDRRQMGLTLLANFVIVPIVGFILVRALDLRPEIRIGIMMLACSPGGLFALQFARISKGNRVFAVALLIVLALLSGLDHAAVARLVFSRAGHRRRANPATRPVIAVADCSALPHRTRRATTDTRSRAQARPVFGRTVDRDFHHYGFGEQQVQETRDQSARCRGDNGDRSIDDRFLDRRLVAGRAGDKKPESVGDQYGNAQCRGLLPTCCKLFPWDGSSRSHLGLQRHFDSDEYGVRDRHRPCTEGQGEKRGAHGGPPHSRGRVKKGRGSSGHSSASMPRAKAQRAPVRKRSSIEGGGPDS